MQGGLPGPVGLVVSVMITLRWPERVDRERPRPIDDWPTVAVCRGSRTRLAGRRTRLAAASGLVVGMPRRACFQPRLRRRLLRRPLPTGAIRIKVLRGLDPFPGKRDGLRDVRRRPRHHQATAAETSAFPDARAALRGVEDVVAIRRCEGAALDGVRPHPPLWTVRTLRFKPAHVHVVGHAHVRVVGHKALRVGGLVHCQNGVQDEPRTLSERAVYRMNLARLARGRWAG